VPGVSVLRISGEVAAQGRERLLDAAVRLIAREGIDNVRIARIATEAGVSAGLVHYHFASRDALLEEAIEHSYERAGDMRLAALGDPKPVILFVFSQAAIAASAPLLAAGFKILRMPSPYGKREAANEQLRAIRRLIHKP